MLDGQMRAYNGFALYETHVLGCHDMVNRKEMHLIKLCHQDHLIYELMVTFDVFFKATPLKRSFFIQYTTQKEKRKKEKGKEKKRKKRKEEE